MLRAQEYEQAQGIVSPTATSTGASQTVTSSGAAVGTIATADAVLPQLPRELAENPPEEEAYYQPAQEAAPMPAEDDTYASQSQVCHVLLTFPTYLNRGSLTIFFSCLLSILLCRKVCPRQRRRAKIKAMSTCLRKRKALILGPDGSFLREMEEEGAFIDSTIP